MTNCRHKVSTNTSTAIGGSPLEGERTAAWVFYQMKVQQIKTEKWVVDDVLEVVIRNVEKTAQVDRACVADANAAENVEVVEGEVELAAEGGVGKVGEVCVSHPRCCCCISCGIIRIESIYN